MIFQIILIALMISWLIAEVRGAPPWLRLTFGCSAIVASGFAATEFTLFSPHYERAFHKVLFRELATSLSRGDIAQTAQAIDAYNSSMERHNDTYKAGGDALEALSAHHHK